MSLAATASCRIRQALIRSERRRADIHIGREEGAGAVFSVAQLLRSNRLRKPMVVFRPEESAWGERVVHALDESDLSYALWNELPASPTAEDGDRLCLQWITEQCDCFVAVGDAAVIDLTKAAAACAHGRGRSIRTVAGRNRVKTRVPVVIAVPTVAGSGAESLTRAELSDARDGSLRIVSDAILPRFAVLDPELLSDAPRESITEAVVRGLCLATEAYLSGFADDAARALAASAVRGLLEAGEPCWNNGGSPMARATLLSASCDAGEAASGAGFGYADALSRSVADTLNMRYGDTCAAILPVVLEKYGNSATGKLAELAERCGAAEPERTKTEKAAALLDRIRQLFFCIGLPETLPAMGRDTVEAIASRASRDANPWCACPEVWQAEEWMSVLRNAGAFDQ